MTRCSTGAVLLAAASLGCQSSSDGQGASVFEDAALVAYLQSVADEVSGDSMHRVVVYDADFAQAFALPGGEIALTLGMLAFIHNEAELACVLGHEIAHHRLGHVSAAFGAASSPPIDDSHPLAEGWPDAEERAADELGLSLCGGAGYEALCASHLLFRAARTELGESVDELLDDEAGARPLVDRTRETVDAIGRDNLEGGHIGYSEYASVRDSLAGTRFVEASTNPGATGPKLFPYLARGAVAVALNYEEFKRDNFAATEDWAERECRDGIDVIPTNHLDAFGHCWAGCRAQELCGSCQNPGLYYEVARETGYRGEHDSFWQDWRNQEIGGRGANLGSSCSEVCTDEIESGGLDLSAPQANWWDCTSDLPAPDNLLDERPSGGRYTDYGALGSPDIFGDPHLVTMDGLRYDFHGVGEFLAMASLHDDLTVQVRFAEVAALQASKTTAVAANINGDRVGAYLGPGDFVVRVNGERLMPSGSWVALSNGGYVQLDDDQVVFEWPDDTRLWVYYWGDVLDLSMTLPAQRHSALAGLLGNADGDPTNEYITREGVPVEVPDESGAARRQALYSEFGESWRISATESLFDYEAGESTDDFQMPGFPESDLTIDDLDPVTLREAREDCIALGITESPWLEDCIFDVGFTGEISWANSTRNAADPNSLSWNEMYEAAAEIDGGNEQVVIMERFIGRAGEEHFFRIVQTMPSLGLANWEVFVPSGDRLFLNCVYACGQPGAFALPETGLYISQLSSDPGERGVLKVARNIVPDPEQFNIGSATSVALESLDEGAGLISVPGDEDLYRIDGRAGTTITLTPVEIDPALFFGHWKLADSSGMVLFDRILPTTGGLPFSENIVSDGTYFLTIDGGDGWTSEGQFGYGRYRIQFQLTPTP